MNSDMGSDANLEESEADREALRERLKHCAKKVGTADELSRRTGITRRTLANYLSGRNDPKSSAIVRIAKVAGVSADWLLGMDDIPDAKAVEPASEDFLDPELVRSVFTQLAAYLQREKLWHDLKPVEIGNMAMILCDVVSSEARNEHEDLGFERYAEIVQSFLRRVK
jgi:transcriptional regulator with XRE-family HTH domain